MISMEKKESGLSHKWTKEVLLCKRSRVKDRGSSMWHSSGIMLRPLLFIVYLNDFEGCLDFSKANMYADDAHTTIASNDVKELVRMTKKELLNISEWLRVNKLSANPKKTEFMVIGHQRRMNEIDDLLPLELNDSGIKRVEKTKSLGFIIDEGLKWKDQYKSLTGKLAAGLSSLKELKDVLPQ